MLKLFIAFFSFFVITGAEAQTSQEKIIVKCAGVENPELSIHIVQRSNQGMLLHLFSGGRLVGLNPVAISRNSNFYIYDGARISILIPLSELNKVTFPALLQFNGKKSLICSR